MAIVCQIVVVEHIGNMGDWQPAYLAIVCGSVIDVDCLNSIIFILSVSIKA